MNPFTVSNPDECAITYACSMIEGPDDYNLCNYIENSTIASFNSETGDFEFESNDFNIFGGQTLSFEVEVSSGSEPQTVMNLFSLKCT